ncbi:tRNA guanosine(34) transglycosylase Tgt [Mucisphaera calidilacus]|uniref:Queuine tRNA-ribosyltransferase n=1 Tax=Mucisphaera calidilacus TaxID=2527982 RepID=A0A518BUT4_9BACT|nr:tRNA guanosine(34) transglycosylase Tgt [Mucisphaera calidilacus]QDU70721.1 Queuine tRNA-ribosyltransferase [Mucisphaera calidilacus]
MPALTYTLLREDGDPGSRARLGRVETPHGGFDTPAFMPVGTAASVKGLLPEAVGSIGAQIILSNTYHLLLRPGEELVQRMGGLQKWMRWDGPVLTDSGGYQVFSFADKNSIGDDGVKFRSHLDGREIHLSPERSIAVQNALGADIIMAFDDCPPAPDRPEVVEATALGPRHAVPDAEYQARLAQANDRTARWLARCVKAHQRPADQALFGIVQGGIDLDARRQSVEQVCQHDLPGFAIGGVAVGEGFDQLKRVTEHTAPLLPEDRPRYLMGVGYERDLVTAVRAGVDMFDCVLPTRNARNANAFTPFGQIRLRNARFSEDERVLDAGCDCPACAGGFSRSYLRHLFIAGEMLGGILLSLHNLRHFQRLMLDIRAAIRDNTWSAVGRHWPVTLAEGPGTVRSDGRDLLESDADV